MNTNPKGDAGEHFNVRQVHGAIMREYKLPGEDHFLISWRMKVFYHLLALIGILYAVSHATGWDWEQYDSNPATEAQTLNPPSVEKK